MKKHLLIAFTLSFPLLSFSQQDPQYSQYLFNGVIINPAYAGSRETININALYRKQWVQVNGSPTSQTISVDVPLYNNHMGLGIYAYNDKIGAQYQNGIFAAFAYRVKVSTKGRLALGLSAGINQIGLDGSKLNTDQPDDPAVATARVSKTKPDAQAGVYFHTHKFFAGLSVSNIIINRLKDDQIISERRHFYLASGFVKSISKNFKLRPSFLIKEDFKAPTNADLSAFVIFKEKIWLGTSYRTRILKKGNIDKNIKAKDAVVLMIQIFPIENLRMGYGYDISLGDYQNYATHEFSLGYNISSRKNSKMLTPRYF